MSTPTNLNIAELDFDSVKASLRDFLRSQTQFKDYDFEGSGLSVLLDVLAYNSHYFAWYHNMIGSEMFLDSAVLRSSVVSLAKHLGYTPRSVTAARANVSISVVPTDNAAAMVINNGTAFTSTIDNVTYSFVTAKAYSATVEDDGTFQFPNVELVQGIPYTYRITVDATIPNQRFGFANTNVDTSTLSVQVQNSSTDLRTKTYTFSNTLLSITAESLVYFLQEDEDGTFEVYFGDGVLGRSVQDGNVILIQYILTNGADANGASVFVPAQPLGGYPLTNTLVTTLVPAAGGADAESIDQIRFSAPKNYVAQQRAVTVADYVFLIQNQYPNADSVTVWGGEDNIPPQYGKVFVSIKPVDGFVITQATKQLVLQDMIRKFNVVSIIPTFVDPDYTYIIVNSTVKYNPASTSKTVGDIQSGAYKAIIGFAKSNLDKFDLQLRYSRLLTAIDDSDSSISNNLTTIQMKKVFSPQMDVALNYTLTTYNGIRPGTVASSSFISVADPLFSVAYSAGKTYTIQDDGFGVLQIIQSGIGVPQQVVRSCGTVDYVKGVIQIQSLIPFQVNADGTMVLTMSPQQNDIVPQQNNILFIQPQDVFVSAVPLAS